MTSFKDLWQAQRAQRQQGLVQRQQEVFALLNEFQQDRHTTAAEVRDRLDAFYKSLQQDTRDLLSNAQHQRHVMASQQMAELQAFKHNLQQQTAQILSIMTAERSLMAQQVTQDLATSRHNLLTSVATLRQSIRSKLVDIQGEVQALQATTHEMLNEYQQERLENAAVLAEKLTIFVAELQREVQSNLLELAELRQERAQNLQEMLQQERTARIAEVEATFDELAQFRSELRQYCQNLHALVWGNSSTVAVAQPAIAQPAVSSALKAKPLSSKPQPAKAVSRLTSKAPRVRAASSKPTAKVLQVSQAAVKPAEPKLEAAVQPQALPSPSPEPPAPQSAVAPADDKTAPSNVSHAEKDIYTYLHETKGARLTEIETALGINRFQAVDALRTLIKKSLVIQRDRIYLVQETIG